MLLKEMIESGAIEIAGDSYNITSGVVEFYPETMIINSRLINE